MENFNINRRQFLHSASASLALSVLGLNGLDIIHKPGSWRVGLIGAGWYGKNDLFRLVQVAPVDIIAICDVDQKLLQGAAELAAKRQKSGKTPQLYRDYRKMLANHEFDIVIIGTPDHWHALPAIAAIEAGAHLYLQKPISVDVLEGEAILAAARKHHRKVQIGTQRRSTPHLVEAKKNIIDAGLLGKVSHAEVCCYYHMRANGNPEIIPVPDFFDYDLWSGPAPLKPFRGLPHRRWWRTQMEYSNGIVGDMCVHMLDAVRWLLGLGWPTRISSTGGIYVQKGGISNTSDTQSAIFEFDEFTCVWQHRTWGSAPDPDYPWAFKIYGDKGTLKGSVHKYEFETNDGRQRMAADALYEKKQYPEDAEEQSMEHHAAPATRRQMLDLLAAIEEDRLPVADVEEGHISSASCILANISMELGGRQLIYDPKQHLVLNDAEATAKLARTYRGPWQHPYQKG